MAQELYGFFNSTDGDAREYDADALAAAFRTLTSSGVAAPDGACLRVSAEGSTMRTLVGCGSAFVRGYHFELREDGGAAIAFTHTTATDGDRIDRIVVRLNADARTISLQKKVGAAGASPEAPTLTRTDAVYELSLAQVRVREGATAIAASDVTDERADEGVCGAALPEGVTLSAVFKRMAKWNASAERDGLMSKADKTALDAAVAARLPALETAAQTASGERAALSQSIGALETALTDDSADTQIHVYAHGYNADTHVHSLTGAGANGRVKPTRIIANGDTFAVNGVTVDVYRGDDALTDWTVGRWMTFVYDAEEHTVNFKSGGSAVHRVVAVEAEAALTEAEPQNALAVLTSEPIRRAALSEAQPMHAAQGDVWVQMHTRSSYPIETVFSHYANETRAIGPVRALQYRSGAWEPVRAWLRNDGAWRLIEQLDLFNNGNQAAAVTGGWTQHPTSLASGCNINTVGGALTILGSGGQNAYFRTIGKVAVAPYKRLVVEGTFMPYGTYAYCYAGLTVTDANGFMRNDLSPMSDTKYTTNTIVCELGSLKNSAYVALGAPCIGVNLRVTRVWLEG